MQAPDNHSLSTVGPGRALAAQAFAAFADGLAERGALRRPILDAWRRPEPEALAPLLACARLPAGQAERARALALRLAGSLRRRGSAEGRAGLVQALLQEYALSSEEGVALMCLAEALLRIPDAATRDALIRDKIAGGHWQAHAGHSPSIFVNAVTWGLFLTGKLVSTHSEGRLSAVLTRLVGKGGEPLIRRGVDLAMRMMGEQFVTGETIGRALANSRERRAQGFRYSYDMLGEAALTAADAERCRLAYEHAIHAIGQASRGAGVYEASGISIKLSALHPRYQRAQYARVMDELYPALRDLAGLARRHDIGLNIDAEESERLDLSLDLLERLCREPALAGWSGIGFVVQAYQKRCPFVIDHLVDLARRSGHRLMVRLVKGAYWDSEIKRAQLDGLEGYPVYTRKAHTDVSYLACARRLLAAPDAIYPQFATHNAHSLAAVREMADPARYRPGQYEFQCLHGMGEPLYEQVVAPVDEGGLGLPCRIYAPVGPHETLLAYLVRRLLENGANTSFVHRIADPSIPLGQLVEDPVAAVGRAAREEGRPGLAHPAIPLPRDLYRPARANSRGVDLSNDDRLRGLRDALADSFAASWSAAPMLGEARRASSPVRTVVNPADHADVIGQVEEADRADVQAAAAQAARFSASWAATPVAARAAMLERAADLLEDRLPRLLALLVREAGKTCANAVAEVRESVDFLRYYAAQARADFDARTHRPLGPVACISPWNFPLAIFTGQIAAALAAGNAVIAKPAEQTPLIAAEAARLLHRAGVPAAALQLLPGAGESVGAELVADARVQGVMFTGSTEVARAIARTLARRLGAAGQPVPLIAETGGQNAMIVDSSALSEQVVADVLGSAFDSAGQRCSALRVLCVQEDVAGRLITMLHGAMAQCRVGNPAQLAVDFGPVIDARAQQGLEAHVAAMRERGCGIHRAGRAHDGELARGTFVMPTLVAIERIDEIGGEVFGPVLHVLRYRRGELDALLGQINGTGYGLTLGVHTRIDETLARVVAAARAGNVYVNRNMVGAVVGVQPFGGEGLSGTGPKAGGPLYMYRLLSERPHDVLVRALADADPARPVELAAAAPCCSPALRALAEWAAADGQDDLAKQCERFARISRAGYARTLAGPTGERNVYSLQPREAVLCLAESDSDRLVQLAAVLAVGSRAIWPAQACTERLRALLPERVRQAIALARDWRSPSVAFDAVLHHGPPERLPAILEALAAREGPIVGVRSLPAGDMRVPLEHLVVERSLSVNTAAAGGNASLMMVG